MIGPVSKIQENYTLENTKDRSCKPGGSKWLCELLLKRV